MANMEPLLRCTDLRKRYGDRTAVDGISFTIAPGQTYGLLGPNGAGKTTTISMLCGLLRRDGGEVFVAGRPVDIGATEAKTSIGYVPQDLAIYPDLTARENLRFFGRLQRLGGRELDRRVDEILALTDLSDRANDRVDSFSGGMKRRRRPGRSRGSAPSGGATAAWPTSCPNSPSSASSRWDLWHSGPGGSGAYSRADPSPRRGPRPSISSASSRTGLATPHPRLASNRSRASSRPRTGMVAAHSAGC